MKKIIILLSCLWSVAEAQTGYTTVYTRLNYANGIAGGSLNIPAGTTPVLSSGQMQRAGALYYDSTGGNRGFHGMIGNNVWVKLADTTYTGFSKDRFGFTGEDVTATAARAFNSAGNNFTLDGLGNTRINTSSTKKIDISASHNNVDSAYQYVSKNLNLGVNFLKTGNGVYRSLDAITSEFYTQIQTAAGLPFLKAQVVSPARFTNWVLVDTNKIQLYANHGGGLNGESFVDVHPDSVVLWIGSRSSQLTIANNYADQFADDSVIWRLTNRDASLTFDVNGWHAWQKDGEYYFYNLQHTINAADKMVTVDTVTGELHTRAIPSGGSQGLQDVITVDPVLTTNNSINVGGNDLIIYNGSLDLLYANGASGNSGLGGNTINIQAQNDVQIAGDQVDVGTDSFRTLRAVNVHQIGDSAGWYFKIRNKVSGVEADAYWPAGGSSGITQGTTTITSGTSTRVAFNNAGVYGEDAGLTFNPTTNLLTVTGPASDLANGPKMNYNFNSDANPALSYFFYTHDNLAITLDSYYNGGWVSSDAGSNFLLYKNAGELKIGYNAGTAAGSSFSPNLTDGVRFTSTGRLGIGVAAAAKLHVLSTTEQLRVGYDGSNYYSTTVGSTGGVTFNAVGSGSAFTYSDAVTINGDLTLGTAGNKIFITTGSNASIGTSAAMTAGTITISTTAVSANSKVFLSVATPGGTQGFLSVGTIVAGTSFVINSSGATDTSTVNWWIIN